MGDSIQEQRWAENEVIFRQANERVTKNVARTKAIAEEEGQQHVVSNIDDMALLFYCECSDEKCHERISLTPREYSERHQNSSQFILLPGHNKPQVERTVYDGGHYLVVEKFITPPKKVGKLNKS